MATLKDTIAQAVDRLGNELEATSPRTRTTARPGTPPRIAAT